MQRAELELTFMLPSGLQVQAEYYNKLYAAVRIIMTIREAVVSYYECTCKFSGVSLGPLKDILEVLGNYEGVLARLTDVEYHVER